MPDISNAVPTELPTTRKLIRSTVIAMIIAITILFAVVLPAEYGVDPTGIGDGLGLTEMGRIKTSLAREARLAEEAAKVAGPGASVSATSTAPAVAASAPAPVSPASAGRRNDVTTIVLQPGQGREIKLSMRQGAQVTFSWSTDRGVVNYDTHADSTTPPRPYHAYEKGSGVATDDGQLTAAFDGWHGWFWRNRGKEVVTVTLRTNGNYQELKEPE